MIQLARREDRYLPNTLAAASAAWASSTIGFSSISIRSPQLFTCSARAVISFDFRTWSARTYLASQTFASWNRTTGWLRWLAIAQRAGDVSPIGSPVCPARLRTVTCGREVVDGSTVCGLQLSLRPKRMCWIRERRPPRREITRRERDTEQQRRCGSKTDGIEWRNAVQQTLHSSREDDCSAEA